MKGPSLPRTLCVAAPAGGDGREYLIWSHKWGRWHRRTEDGTAAGYTADIAQAGIFDRAKALQYHEARVEKCIYRMNSVVHVRDQIAALKARAAEIRAEAVQAEALADMLQERAA